MTRKWIISVAAACLCAGGVAADDRIAGTTAEPAGFDWSGFYAGANAGSGAGTFLHPFSLSVDGLGQLVSGSLDVDADGFAGGVQAGYSHVYGSLLFGAEADIQGATVEARIHEAATDSAGDFLNPGETLALDAGTRVDWFGTFRGRAGWISDPLMFYVTVGPAWGVTTSSVRVGIEGQPSAFEASVTAARLGVTAGAGFEIALGEDFTFRTEYLYTDFGMASLLAEGLVEGADAALGAGVAFHSVRVGLSYHF